MMKSVIVNEVHKLILNSVNKQIAIDATCDNGNDTVFCVNTLKKFMLLISKLLPLKEQERRQKTFKT